MINELLSRSHTTENLHNRADERSFNSFFDIYLCLRSRSNSHRGHNWGNSNPKSSDRGIEIGV